jgi:hypothetical protein
MECMNTIESLHFALHDKYLNVFNIYFSKNEKQGFFAKLFGFSKKKELSEDEIFNAKQYYLEMEKISKQLLEEISRLERRLVAVSEEKIRNLV